MTNTGLHQAGGAIAEQHLDTEIRAAGPDNTPPPLHSHLWNTLPMTPISSPDEASDRLGYLEITASGLARLARS